MASPTAVASPAVEHDSTEERGGGGTRRKKRETFLIPDDLADAMRNAIVHLSGPPLYYTLAEFGEHAIRNYIAELERDHNAGQPFPPRPRAVDKVDHYDEWWEVNTFRQLRRSLAPSWSLPDDGRCRPERRTF